ncbi:MAG: hypothetical protein NC218_06450 [Acetobacter sp.]|nr:hypothetical protein [Acetobacter sp.]
MEKIKQLCLFALLLVLSTSCNKLTGTDYETMDYGIITTVDSTKYSLTVHSLTTDSSHNWYVKTPLYDNLSTWGFAYSSPITIGDTVYIYRDGGNLLVSQYNLTDADNIDNALFQFYWHNIAANWLWFGLIFCIIGILGAGMLDGVVRFRTSETPFVVAIIVGWICSLVICHTASELHLLQNGTITAITEKHITLNNKDIIPYATLEDITTHKPVTIGMNVSAYRYTLDNLNSTCIFFSSRPLNQQVLKTSQTYPNIFLLTSLLFWVTAILSQIPFFCLNEFLIKKKLKKTTQS